MPGKPTIVKEGSHHEEARKRIVERKDRKCKEDKCCETPQFAFIFVGLNRRDFLLWKRIK